MFPANGGCLYVGSLSLLSPSTFILTIPFSFTLFLPSFYLQFHSLTRLILSHDVLLLA